MRPIDTDFTWTCGWPRPSLSGQDGFMIDDPSPEPHDSRMPSAHTPESYFWPLIALVLVILPQVLVPSRLREGPPLIVPVIEATVFLALLVVAAKPGPVPRAARPLILSLFAVLVLAEQRSPGPDWSSWSFERPNRPGRHTVTQLWWVPASFWPPTSSPSVCSTGSSTAADRAAARCIQALSRLPVSQNAAEELAPPGWQPRFQDHL